MSELKPQTLPTSIEHEMRTSFIDYAMSVIVSRALPNVRDGLKPVHRRILFAMHGLKNFHNLTGIHDNDVVTKFCNQPQVMGNEQYGTMNHVL